jgi:serine/threonine-protein kinase
MLIAAASLVVLGGVAQAKDMKTCAAEWQAMKKANTTGSQTYKQFTTACMAPMATNPMPAPAPAKTGLFSKPMFSKPMTPSPIPPAKPMVSQTVAAKPARTPVVAAAPRGPIPGGATAVCRDGTYSMNKTHSGSCSRHGGVAQFYK